MGRCMPVREESRWDRGAPARWLRGSPMVVGRVHWVFCRAGRWVAGGSAAAGSSRTMMLHASVGSLSAAGGSMSSGTDRTVVYVTERTP